MSALKAISDVAMEHGLTYGAARERALRGDFGPVRRVGHRLYVEAAPKASSEHDK